MAQLSESARNWFFLHIAQSAPSCLLVLSDGHSGCLRLQTAHPLVWDYRRWKPLTLSLSLSLFITGKIFLPGGSSKQTSPVVSFPRSESHLQLSLTSFQEMWFLCLSWTNHSDPLGIKAPYCVNNGIPKEAGFSLPTGSNWQCRPQITYLEEEKRVATILFKNLWFMESNLIKALVTLSVKLIKTEIWDTLVLSW